MVVCQSLPLSAHTVPRGAALPAAAAAPHQRLVSARAAGAHRPPDKRAQFWESESAKRQHRSGSSRPCFPEAASCAAVISASEPTPLSHAFHLSLCAAAACAIHPRMRHDSDPPQAHAARWRRAGKSGFRLGRLALIHLSLVDLTFPECCSCCASVAGQTGNRNNNKKNFLLSPIRKQWGWSVSRRRPESFPTLRDSLTLHPGEGVKRGEQEGKRLLFTGKSFSEGGRRVLKTRHAQKFLGNRKRSACKTKEQNKRA